MLFFKTCLNSSKPKGHCLVIIRWRKPIYAPIAPSKLFRVVERNKQPSEEKQFLLKQYANYRSQMRSIKSYLAKNLEKSYKDLHKVDDEFILNHNKFIDKSNILFNEKSAQNRLEREEKEEKEIRIKIQTELEEIKMQEKVRREIALQKVLQTKKDSEKFITLENLDSAIDSILNERSAFRFAIDQQGNKYEELVDGSIKIVERKTMKNVTKINPNLNSEIVSDSTNFESIINLNKEIDNDTKKTL